VGDVAVSMNGVSLESAAHLHNGAERSAAFHLLCTRRLFRQYSDSL
jgi:hypothetical protein